MDRETVAREARRIRNSIEHAIEPDPETPGRYRLNDYAVDQIAANITALLPPPPVDVRALVKNLRAEAEYIRRAAPVFGRVIEYMEEAAAALARRIEIREVEK